jgi:branched-chain amino acid transport system permease protein
MMLLQVIINALIAAAIYGMVGLSFAIIYRPTRFFNFAHGATFVSGAYLCYVGHIILDLPFWIATILAIGGAALLGAAMDLFIYRPARRRGATSTILLIMSLGTYLVLQNLISLFFGDDTRSVWGSASAQKFVIYDAYVTKPQVWIICSAVGLFFIVWFLLGATRIGKGIRAVASDPELAKVTGTNVDGVILMSFILGSALAGFAGVLTSLDTDMIPTMGLNVLMMAVIAVIVGGSGNISGVALGALLLGLGQHFGVREFGTAWQDAIAFLILIVFLLLRPTGFSNTSIRKTQV